LFEMLANKRFDAFPRGVVEVLEEYDTRKNTLPDLYIEPSILLYYPLPMYFWFSKTDEGRRMAARVEEGMWMMIRDGSYDRIFEQYQGYKIKKLKLGQRKLFKIGNPLLVPETPFKDKRLWFDLDAYQARHGNEPKH
jgi:ABC-type amino acid transport substrate-binding protein